MSQSAPLLAALELTGGERIVLRAGERPHLVLDETRHDLVTAAVATPTTLDALAHEILSPAGRRALADQDLAVEPLPRHVSAIPVVVVVRRLGSDLSVELCRGGNAPDAGYASPESTEASTPPASRPAVHGSLDAATPIESGLDLARQAPTGPTAERAAVMSAFDGLIRAASRRGATTLYLRPGEPPVACVGARIEPLTSEPVERRFVHAVSEEIESRDADWQPASPGMWVCRHEDLGEVRCRAFADERGQGLMVRLAAQRASSPRERDVPRPVRRICEEDDGVVVVAGTATTTMLDMMTTVATWAAARRGGYLISVQPPCEQGDEAVGPFVSVRTAGGERELAQAVRQAAQEAPDVLAVAPTSGAAIEEALRAARPDRLVVIGLVAASAPRALESLLASLTPPGSVDLRPVLAAWFRCAFSHRALRSARGGRKVVSDLLTATPDMCARLERWERWDAGALEKWQRSGGAGMRSLDVALAVAVLQGDISLRQAATQAIDGREVVRIVRWLRRERRRRRRQA